MADQGKGTPQWLQWARRLAAISQNGLLFSKDPYDRERYEELRSIAAEMLADGANLDVTEVRQLLARESGYATPKVDLRAAVFDGTRVLLVKEGDSGLWSLPGGWAEPGESPSDALVREVLEETGYHVVPVKLAAVYDREKRGHVPSFPFHVYKLFFLCAIEVQAEPSAHRETDVLGHAFFEVDKLPPLCSSRVLREQIEHCYALHTSQSTQIAFD